MKFTTKIAQEITQAKKTLTTLAVAAAAAALIWGGVLAPNVASADAPTNAGIQLTTPITSIDSTGRVRDSEGDLINSPFILEALNREMNGVDLSERVFDDGMKLQALDQRRGVFSHGSRKLGKMVFALLGGPFVECRDSDVCEPERGENVSHIVA